MDSSSPQQRLRMPRSTWFIVSTEACERFSFYGMASILTLYLQNLFLHHQVDVTAAVQSHAEAFAKERVHLFNAAVYYLPLLGGFLADKYFGRYRTILVLSLFYCLGHGSLALFEGKESGIYLGLALIALGAGGIKPCVSAFVADQFEHLDERGLSKIYGIFYWAVNLGAAAAFAIIPAVAENKTLGYRWAFGIPGIFMAIAALVYWAGTPLYVKRPPQVQSDVAIKPQQKREDRKTLWRIILVLSPIIIFWALYYQLNTSWVQQGEQMTPYYLVGNSKTPGSYSINSQTIQSASAILVLTLVPVMGIWGYPFMKRLGLPTSIVGKMIIGTVAIAASFIVVGIYQNYLDRGGAMSILWQLLAYVPLEIGEVMVSIPGLEFAYANAPPRMKSLVMGVWFCITASGNVLVALITWVNENTIQMNMATQFYFYAGLMLLGTIAFAFIAKALLKEPAHVEAAPQS